MTPGDATRILVLGTRGRVARALLAAAPQRCVARGRPELDLTRPDSIDAAIAETKPDIVVNAAAYTAVDAAEEAREEAFAVNAQGARAAAEACARAGLALIHLSTDFVFDGTKPSPYVEADAPNPVNVYGQSKLAGERAIADRLARHVVLRTAWVYGAQDDNFVTSLLRQARHAARVPAVEDQRGCPTFVDDLAQAVLAVAGRLGQTPRWGLYHATATGEASRLEFAQAIFAGARALGGPSAQAVPISSADLARKARRPANSRLDCSRLAAEYGVRISDWRAGLARCLERLAQRGWPQG